MSAQQKPTYPVRCDVYLDREKVAAAIAERGKRERSATSDDEEKPDELSEA